MADLRNAILNARRYDECSSTFYFSLFEGYTEIREDGLENGFLDNKELAFLKSGNRRMVLCIIILVLMGCIGLTAGCITHTLGVILFGLVAAVMSIVMFCMWRKRKNALDSELDATEKLQRGIAVDFRTVSFHPGFDDFIGVKMDDQPVNIRIGRSESRYYFHFATVFFPETRTYIKSAFCYSNYRPKIGEDVAVCMLTDDIYPSCIPSGTHTASDAFLERYMPAIQQHFQEKTNTEKAAVKKSNKVLLIVFLCTLAVMGVIAGATFLLSALAPKLATMHSSKQTLAAISEDGETSVYIRQDGFLSPYRILSDDYHGKILLLSEKSYDDAVFDSKQQNTYSKSEIDKYLNGEFLKVYSNGIRNSLETVPILVADSKTGKTEKIERKVFLLSASEVGSVHESAAAEGDTFAYFKEKANRVPVDSHGRQESLWLRSPVIGSKTSVWVIGVDGDTFMESADRQEDIRFRPAIVLDGDLQVSKTRISFSTDIQSYTFDVDEAKKADSAGFK